MVALNHEWLEQMREREKIIALIDKIEALGALPLLKTELEKAIEEAKQQRGVK